MWEDLPGYEQKEKFLIKITHQSDGSLVLIKEGKEILRKAFNPKAGVEYIIDSELNIKEAGE
jgi:hypothetical protein